MIKIRLYVHLYLLLTNVLNEFPTVHHYIAAGVAFFPVANLVPLLFDLRPEGLMACTDSPAAGILHKDGRPDPLQVRAYASVIGR
jgi:hypothetical protein